MNKTHHVNNVYKTFLPIKNFLLKQKRVAMGVIFILLVLAFAIDTKKETLGWFVWNHTHWAEGALAFENKDPKLFVDIGSYYFEEVHNLERADTFFRKALFADPSAEWAHYQLARVAFIRGDTGTAFYEIGRELRLHPENGRAYYVQGLIYGYRGSTEDLEKAEESFKQFVAWAPHEWAGYNDLAWIQVKNKKFKDAEGSVLSAFEKLPYEKKRNVWLWTSLGVAELNTGNYNESKEAFLNAERISKGITADYFMGAYPGNDPRNAEQFFNQFRATLFLNLGIVNEKLGFFEEARNAYNSYLSILPDGPYPTKGEIEERIRGIAKKI